MRGEPDTPISIAGPDSTAAQHWQMHLLDPVLAVPDSCFIGGEQIQWALPGARTCPKSDHGMCARLSRGDPGWVPDIPEHQRMIPMGLTTYGTTGTRAASSTRTC